MDRTYEVPMNVALPMGANERPNLGIPSGSESGAAPIGSTNTEA